VKIDSGQKGGFTAQPGDKIRLINESPCPTKYRLEFGEYGDVTIEVLPGATVSLTCGNKAPAIHILESDLPQGIAVLPRDEADC